MQPPPLRDQGLAPRHTNLEEPDGYTRRGMIHLQLDARRITDVISYLQSSRNTSAGRSRSKCLGATWATSQWRLDPINRDYTRVTESRWFPRLHAATVREHHTKPCTPSSSRNRPLKILSCCSPGPGRQPVLLA